MALLPEMLIVKVAPKDHMLASIGTQGEEHSHEVFIIGVTLSNLDIYGSDIYITQASCQELVCRCEKVWFFFLVTDDRYPPATNSPTDVTRK